MLNWKIKNRLQGDVGVYPNRLPSKRGYVFTEAARFSALLTLPEGDNIGKSINDAMKAIETENEELKDILPKSYNRLENDVLVALLKAFSSIAMDIEGDVFGKIYEYFLGKFAMTEGQREESSLHHIHSQADCRCH